MTILLNVNQRVLPYSTGTKPRRLGGIDIKKLEEVELGRKVRYLETVIINESFNRNLGDDGDYPQQYFLLRM